MSESLDHAGPPRGPSPRWQAWRAGTDLDEYEQRWNRLAAEGAAIHGEADAVCRLGASRVLDAGCGMGRVAVELHHRGVEVIGVDADPDMLTRARAAAPDLRWVHADLASVDLGDRFDLVLMAGNILNFVHPGAEPAIVANLARHLQPGGLLVAGASSSPAQLAAYDRWCADHGLEPVERWATWDGEPYNGGSYGVTVHRRAP